jgi:hypothetical protein
MEVDLDQAARHVGAILWTPAEQRPVHVGIAVVVIPFRAHATLDLSRGPVLEAQQQALSSAR